MTSLWLCPVRTGGHQMARNDEEDPKESAMLPAKIRGQSPEVIDKFVAAKMFFEGSKFIFD